MHRIYFSLGCYVYILDETLLMSLLFAFKSSTPLLTCYLNIWAKGKRSVLVQISKGIFIDEVMRPSECQEPHQVDPNGIRSFRTHALSSHTISYPRP